MNATQSPPQPITVPTPGHITTRNRRRPALLALAIAFLLLSALAGWWAFTQISTTSAVIGVRQAITRGEVIQREDLVVMQVSQDPNLSTIPADQVDQVIGRRAATDLPAGVPVPRDAFTDQLRPPGGRSIIGVYSQPGFAPHAGLVVGARVTLVPLEGMGQAAAESPATTAPDDDPSAAPTPNEGPRPGPGVAGVIVAVDSPGDGNSRIDVEVEAGVAAGLQRLAAAGRLAVVLESQER